ncbi:MAG: heparinase II/III family protein [Chitinophagaceae bacterium]
MKTLSHLLAITLLLSVSNCLKAQKDYIGNTPKLKDHPRILLLKGEEAAIKQSISADKTWAKINQVILGECDKMINLAPVEKIKIGRRLLDKSRESLRRIFFLSYAWRVTQDEKYLKRAENELLKVSAFDDWNPSHFLDVAEMTTAVSIGYDWLYQNLSAESRSAIKDAIIKKGIEPSLDPRNTSWLKVNHNWNQVCNTGMAYGAMAIFEDNPELARKIINRSIEMINIPMKEYGPDGNYTEGYGYWGYGTTYNVLFISALDKLFGQDFGLTENPGFLKTASFLENMTGPSGDAFNFFDSGAGGELNSAMFWFANKLKDPSLLWVERTRLTDQQAREQIHDRMLPSVMIWSGGMNISEISAPKTLMFTGRGKNPVAMMRSSWTDTAAIYVGIKGGSPSLNHAHMDIGSFIMEADGVRWAMDFGMQNYESLESKKVDLWNMKQNSQRWQVLRYNNMDHNTLTVNNELQKVEGDAPLTGFSKNPLFMNAVFDLSSVYKGPLVKANRGIALVDKKYVMVRDEMETSSNETTIRWNLVTPAHVTITGKNTAELTKNGRKLILRVQEPATVTMKTWSTDPVHDYDAPNPGTMMVGFEVQIPANTRSALTVLLIPEKAVGSVSSKALPLQQWEKE